MTWHDVYTSAHVDEGALVRLLDRASPPEEAAQIREHLERCAECAAIFVELQGLSDTFARVLQRDDAETVRVRWWTIPLVRIAAVLVLAIGAMLAAPPVRAWFGDRWEDVKALLASSAAPPEQRAPAPPTAVSSRVGLVPQEDVFMIELATVQAGGTLTIDVGTGPAYADVIGGDGRDEVIVFPASLRIDNTPASTTTFHVRLPATLRAIEVRIGGRVMARRTPAEVGTGWVIDLGDRAIGR